MEWQNQKAKRILTGRDIGSNLMRYINWYFKNLWVWFKEPSPPIEDEETNLDINS